MAIKTSKYFLGSAGNNYSIFDLDYALINYGENEISFKGGAGVDNVYVGNGFTYDFTESLGSIDKLYLKGASSDFNYAYDADSGVLTLTHKTLTTTIIRVSPDDKIIFTDGSVSAGTITNNLPATGANLATNLLNASELSSTNPNDLLSGIVSNNTLKAFAMNGNGTTFAQVDPGVQFIAKGGAGLDLVYVAVGSQVDASDLGGGEDKIFLTGNWADYTKTYDADADTLTLARTINGNTEQVIVGIGDRLVFADGYVSTDAAIAYAQDSVANPVTLNTTEVTPGLVITPAQLAALSDAELAALTPAELAPLTAAHLDALTPAQITALGADAASLNPDTLASLDATQVAALAPAAIAALSNEQLAALTPAQIAGLTPAQVDSLSPAQVGAIGSDIASLTPTAAASLDAAQQAAVLPANPAALSDAQLAALTPAQVTGLTAAQIDALTPAQITALGADAASLAPAALASLDAAQIAALTPAAIAALSNEQLAALTPAQVAGITAAQIDALSPAQIGAIGTDIASLTPAASASLDAAQQAAVLPAAPATLSDAQLAALTPAQIAGITAAQIDALTPAQVTALGADAASLTPTALASLDAAQVAALTPAALAALSNDQLAALTPAQIAGITAAQIDALSPAQIGAIGSDISALNTAAAASLDAAQQAAIVPANPAALTDAQLAALSPAQVTGLTAAQIDTLTPAQITALGADAGSLAPAALASLDAAQIAALAPAAVAGLSDAKLAALTPAQVAAITAAQIDALTPAQVAALGSDLPSLSTAALASVDAAQLAAVAPATVAALSDAQLAALTPAQVAGLTAAQVDALTPAQVAALGSDLPSLSTAALASLDAAQIAAVAPATVAALTDAQLAALTPAQVAGLTAAQIDALTPAQVAALGSDLPSLSTAALASVDAAQLAAVAPATLAALSDAQLTALTPAQLANVTAAQIDALTPAQITALGADVNALPVAALASFDAAQVAAITPLSTLSDAQLTALTPAQLANVTAAQIDSLTPAQITALGADVAALPQAALDSLDAAQVAAITPLSALTNAELTALTPAQLANVTAAQIDGLSAAQVTALGTDLSSLPAAAIGSIDATQAAGITAAQLDTFDATDIGALTAAAIGGLTPAALASLDNTQLGNLTPAQLANVTAAQIDSLTPAQITALGADVAALPQAALDSFDAAQVAAITPLSALTNAELTALTPAQLANVTATQIDGLSAAQVAALGADLSSLPTAAIGSIDATQAAGITTTQLDTFDATDLGALTPAAIGGLTPAALASLDATQFATLTPTQVAQITGTQVDALSAAQIAALSVGQAAALSAGALASLDAAQQAALTVVANAVTVDPVAHTISGTLSTALAIGETVKVSLDGGSTWVDATGTAGQSSFTLANAGIDASNKAIQVKVVDALNNSGAVFTEAQFGEVGVSDVAGNNQILSSLTYLNDGGYVVTWVDTRTVAAGEIYMQRYSASGAALLATNGVLVATGIADKVPKVSAMADGGWAIVWDDGRSNTSQGIYMQRFDVSGNAMFATNGLLVSASGTSHQLNPSITALSDGGTLVAWHDARNATSDIYMQRYDANGNALLTANGDAVTTAIENQYRPSVAVLKNGGWVITWYSYNPTETTDTGGAHIMAKVYDAAGNVTKADFLVNTFTVGDQAHPSVSVLNDGSFVVTWQSNSQDGSSWGVFTRHYSASGVALGGESQVNTTTVGDQSWSTACSLADGGYIITWHAGGKQDGDSYGVYMQRYDAADVKVGSETLVNTTTAHEQSLPAITALPDGGWVITWSSTQVDNTTYNIYQQRYAADGSKFGPATLTGTAAADVITAGAGDQTINAGLGNDTLNGGLGNDTAVFSGNKSAYTLTDNGNGTITVAGPDGTDTLSGIENLQFADVTRNLADALSGAKPVAEMITVNAADTSISGTLNNALASGEKVQVRINGGTWTDATSTGNTFTASKSAYAADEKIEVRVTDASGNNAGGVFSQSQFGEQGVSTEATTVQALPLITHLADGGWVVAWSDDRNIATQSWDGYMQRYDKNGVAQHTADGIPVVSTTGNEVIRSITALPDGGWVVVWHNLTAGYLDNYMQRYDAAGNALLGTNGVAFATGGSTNQEEPKVSFLADGGWVIAWEDNRDGANWNVYQQRYDASGNALLTANGVAVCNDASKSMGPSITSLADGGWIVTWQDNRSGDWNIYQQHYNAAGTALLAANGVIVNTTTTSTQATSFATGLADGGWLVTWNDTRGDNTTIDIYQQRYNAAGVAQSATDTLLVGGASNQSAAVVTALADGGWVVAWSDNAAGNADVYMQHYDASGNVVLAAGGVAVATGSAAQATPSITALSDGGWVISWSSDQTGNVNIYQQRYAADGSKLGDVTLTGSAGNDALTGNFADNNFTTSAGTDTIDGGANGNNGDTLTAGTTGPVAIDLTGKNAGTVTDGANVTTFTNVENLTGTSSNADSIKPAMGHNVELSNIGTLSSIEKIDLTATGANTASLTAADVAEMSKAGIVASGANGWSASSAISTTRDQVIVEGTNVDTLNLAGNWSNAGTVTNAGNTYTLYNSRDAGSTAQLIVDADVAVNGNIVADSISLGAGKGYLVAPISFTDGTGAQQTWYVWSDNADGQANTIGYAGSTITDLVDDLGFVFNADVNDYANETAPQTVTINGVTLALGRITNQVHSIDRTPDYEWNTFVQYADGDGNAATRLDRFTLPKLDGWMVDPTAQYVGYYTSQTNAENAAKEYIAGFYPTYNTSGGSAIDSIVPTSTGVMAAFQVTGTGVTTGVPTINPIATDNTITAAEIAVGVTITGTVAAGTTSVNLNFAGTNHAATLNGTTYTYTLQPADLTAMGTGNEIIAVRTNTGATATREITVGELASINPVQLGTAAYLGAAGSTTGSSISFAGDINGDGYEDFIVGAKSANSNAGAAYVVYGNANGIGASLTDGTIDSSKGFKITGPAASNLGLSVSGGGDFNGDGFSDMLVGTDGARNAYVVYGSATPTAVDLSAGTIASNQGYKIIGGAGSTLGVSLATSGDINGDGMDDMVVADVGSASNSWTGAVYVVYGSQTGATLDLSSGTINSSQGFKVTGGTGEYSVNAAGDVNGDGIADLIVGATGKGNVYVVYGTANNSGIDVSATTIPAGKGFTIDGIGTLGYSVAGVGDVNGDGYSDLAIGSYNNNSYTGVGYVVYGSANGTTVDLTSGNIAPAQGFQVNTGLAGSTLGRQVSAAGDVNGDGLADVIISAPDSFGSYVVYGSSTTSNLVLGTDGSIDSSRGFRLTGDNHFYTGWRVDGGGDLNGDGLDDLLITAAGTNSWAGGYHIVLGGQQFATTVDYLGDATANTLTGTATAETFVAGDGNDTLTGNGGADVMMGGKGNDTFTLNASNLTALQSAMGAGGNTTQLATVDGGTGIDTLRVTGGTNLDLTAISNTMEGSRIESVEKIDLATDTAANTLKIKVSDVLDMSEMNVFNNTTLGGTTLGASVAKHQVLVDAAAGDVVQINTTGWTTSSNVVANGHTYDIYNYGTSAAQLLIDHNATVQQVL